MDEMLPAAIEGPHPARAADQLVPFGGGNGAGPRDSAPPGGTRLGGAATIHQLASPLEMARWRVAAKFWIWIWTGGTTAITPCPWWTRRATEWN